MRQTLIVATIILSLWCLCAAGCRHETLPEAAPQSSAPSVEQMADSLLSTMSLEEMAGQLIMPATFTTTDEATLRKLRRYVADAKVGGIVFLKGDTASLHRLTAELQSLSRIPLFLSIDAEWGLGMRLRDAESFPHNKALGEASERQMRDYGERVGRQAAALGLNMLLGPVLDVASVPGSVMSDRSYGSSPQRVADLGVAYSRGVIAAGVMPVAKHFPGHGSTLADSHRTLPVVNADVARLDSVDLLPFARYARAGLPAIMTAHIAVPALDSTATPATLSAPILTDLLRGRMCFKGLIITDAMNMHALDTPAAGGDSPYVAAIKAGADIILVPADTQQAHSDLLQALRDGSLPVDVIIDRCRRILRAKIANQKG